VADDNRVLRNRDEYIEHLEVRIKSLEDTLEYLMVKFSDLENKVKT
jgi:chaperonin cofactor prefoldin